MKDLYTAAFDFLVKESSDPAACWRSAPFWALNGKLTPGELQSQIRGFHQNGLGGFYLHARTGLETPYLSDEWFSCINAAVEEAGKLDMEAWLYDEDRFPSGSGGGLITCDPKCRARGIVLMAQPREELSSLVLPENTLAVFAAEIQGNKAKNYRRLSAETCRQELAPGETLLIFYEDTIACSSWYNNYTYLDTLSVESVRKFIDMTHEAYTKNCSAEFGKTIPGIFTDEPRYGFLIEQPEWDVEKRKILPCTAGFLDEFRETYHYDPLDRLPEYFYAVEGADSVAPRVHYVSLMLKFFKRAFWEPVHKWCAENNLQLTGHPVAEDTLSYQTLGIGSAMQLYEYMDMPGMDLLTEHHRAYLCAKQLSSAARQFGRNRRLVEIYGCTGWDFPIAGMKALGDWLYALGVNYRCEHLAFYTIAGEAKRDYPCPVALQTNARETYLELNDYFARLSVWLSAGKEERNILLIHPIESAWSMFHQNWQKEESTISFDEEFVEVCNTLLAHQLDYDCGDEDILSRIGRIDGDVLHVGEAAYRLVIVPHMITLRSSTLALLEAFQKAGGTVISVGELPTHLDAFKQDIPWHFKRMTNLQEMVDTARLFGKFELADGSCCPALLHQIRRGTDWDVLFICNTGHPVNDGKYNENGRSEEAVFDRKEVYPEVGFSWQSACGGELLEYDPQTGKFHETEAVYAHRAWHVKTSFGRLESRLFIAVPQKLSLPKEPLLRMYPEVLPVQQKIIREKWQIELSESNVAVLDHFSSDPADESEYVLSFDDKLRVSCGVEPRDFMMAQPWCRTFDSDPRREAAFYAVFECEYLPEREIYLVLEYPELYQISLNGKVLEGKDCGSWHASAWRKLAFSPGLLQKGKNIFSFRTEISNRHPGLESMFLLGDFGVRIEGNSFVILPPVTELFCGSWTGQGLPFYPGKVTYKTRILLPEAKTAVLGLPEFDGTPAEIRINGELADKLLFSPAQTKELTLPAEFELQITVTGSMRNACGPFFLKEKPKVYGPAWYKMQEVSERNIVPYGIAEAPEIRWK